jgi:hypothetical protein
MGLKHTSKPPENVLLVSIIFPATRIFSQISWLHFVNSQHVPVT